MGVMAAALVGMGVMVVTEEVVGMVTMEVVEIMARMDTVAIAVEVRITVEDTTEVEDPTMEVMLEVMLVPDMAEVNTEVIVDTHREVGPTVPGTMVPMELMVLMVVVQAVNMRVTKVVHPYTAPVLAVLRIKVMPQGMGMEAHMELIMEQVEVMAMVDTQVADTQPVMEAVMALMAVLMVVDPLEVITVVSTVETLVVVMAVVVIMAVVIMAVEVIMVLVEVIMVVVDLEVIMVVVDLEVVAMANKLQKMQVWFAKEVLLNAVMEVCTIKLIKTSTFVQSHCVVMLKH